MKLYYYYNSDEYEDYDDVLNRLIPTSKFNQNSIEKLKSSQGEYFNVFMNSLNNDCLQLLFKRKDGVIEYIIDINKYFDVQNKIGYKVLDEKTETLPNSHDYYENTYGRDGTKEHFLNICKKLLGKSKVIELKHGDLVLPYIQLNCQALPYFSYQNRSIRDDISQESLPPLMSKW